MTKSTGKRPRYGSDLLTKLTFYSRPGPNGCIDWMAANKGAKAPYGVLYWNGGYTSTHILAWQLYNETVVPAGLVVRHTCDRHQCINPQHLEIGTHADNVGDREARGRGRQPKGEDAGRAKLSEADVKAIRADGRGRRKIAADYGVSPTLIQRIRQGKNWTHL